MSSWQSPYLHAGYWGKVDKQTSYADMEHDIDFVPYYENFYSVAWQI